jgi:hypothetical protein
VPHAVLPLSIDTTDAMSQRFAKSGDRWERLPACQKPFKKYDRLEAYPTAEYDRLEAYPTAVYDRLEAYPTNK